MVTAGPTILLPGTSGFQDVLFMERRGQTYIHNIHIFHIDHFIAAAKGPSGVFLCNSFCRF